MNKQNVEYKRMQYMMRVQQKDIDYLKKQAETLRQENIVLKQQQKTNNQTKQTNVSSSISLQERAR